jgi:NADH-quinone oxidoreductase subunit E
LGRTTPNQRDPKLALLHPLAFRRGEPIRAANLTAEPCFRKCNTVGSRGASGARSRHAMRRSTTQCVDLSAPAKDAPVDTEDSRKVMANRRLHPDQDERFVFTDDNLRWAHETIKKYPEGKQASAVIPLLWRAQEQHNGWLPEPAIRYVAELLSMAPIRVYEIATFYTMFQLSPVGRKAHVQVCGTTPCMLRGSEDLVAICKQRIHKEPHHLDAAGDFSWEEVECLGACANAPMVQVGADVYEDLTPDLFDKVLDGYANGSPPSPGPQGGRTASCPESGPTTLTSISSSGGGQRSGRPPSAPAAAVTAPPSTNADTALATPQPVSGGGLEKPQGISAPRSGRSDNLKQISGVGPQLEGLLNQLGIYHFDQIAAWTPENVRWVDDHLSFKGRIDREDWIAQAQRLALAISGDAKGNEEGGK